MLHLARYAKESVDSKNLCITGGVALNSVANRKILDANIFDNIYINPCCSDTGILWELLCMVITALEICLTLRASLHRLTLARVTRLV